MSEFYYTVVDQAAKMGDAALFSMIGKLKPERRVGRIERVLLDTISLEDEEKAARYFELLMDSISDRELVGFLKPHEHCRKEKTLPSVWGNQKIQDAKIRAYSARAEKAMEIWGKFPTHTVKVGSRLYTENESENFNYNTPTFLATKKQVLVELANHLASTKNESEADKVFEFLSGLGLRFEEEVKMFHEVMRKATDRRFDPARMGRFLVRLNPGEHDRSTLAEIFALGWAKSGGPKAVTAHVELMQPILGKSLSSFNFAKELVQKVGELESRAESLLEAIALPEGSFLSSGEDGRVHRSHINLVYRDFNSIEVKLLFENMGWRHEEYLHGVFDGVKKNVAKWREGNRGMCLKISLLATSRFSSEKPLLERSTEV